MLWEIEIAPAANQVDREAARVLSECHAFGLDSVKSIRSARCFLVEGELSEEDAQRALRELLGDAVVENCRVMKPGSDKQNGEALLNVLLKPGVTDNVASSTKSALKELGLNVDNVATARKYWLNGDSNQSELDRAANRVLANDAIEQVIAGPLQMDSIAVGSDYTFELKTVAIRNLTDDELNVL
ncbi:MAG: phosphoribosylformylglycinamidine synthase subunit PurS, partial [Planctomycetaceae bacterium]